MIKIKMASYAIALAMFSAFSMAPGFAQYKVDQKSLEKSNWYVAPREIHIIDDRPVIHDFREAQPPPQSVALPAGPANQAAPHGAGALSSSAPSLPAGGMHMGGGSRDLSTSLPRAGFGSNMSKAGPMLALPAVQHGFMPKQKIMAQPKQAIGMARPVARIQSAPVAPKGPTPVASYGGYSTGQGTSVGSASRTDTYVRGKLLNQH